MKKTKDVSYRYKKFDKAYYATGGYDDYLKRFEKEGMLYAKELIKKLKPDSQWRFLDVGCGMGGLVMALRRLGFKSWGTEISSYCLSHSPARKWIKSSDICRLPFSDKKFDVVISIDVLCYLSRRDLNLAIKELTRVAKVYLYIETICKDSANSSQKLNPDSLRKDRGLLTIKELKKLFIKQNASFITPLFLEEKYDFNGIFIKRY